MERIIQLTHELLQELEKNGYSTECNVNIMEYDDGIIKIWNILPKEKPWTIDCGHKKEANAPTLATAK
ncbi:MAG: hypothetical protein JM58_09605 [Peptococcaceae bacterium BICA1-8]|nr:MAG: hypothetical protein JM58_09605 [Peptococcaceae bacterium BICA1-8]